MCMCGYIICSTHLQDSRGTLRIMRDKIGRVFFFFPKTSPGAGTHETHVNSKEIDSDKLDNLMISKR